MSKRSRPSPKVKPVVPEPETAPVARPVRRTGQNELLVRIILAALLIGGAVWVGKLSVRDGKVEALLGQAGVEGRVVALSGLREVDYRQALNLDPENAQAAFSLANFLVGRERRYLAQGRLGVVDISRFDEAKELLGSSLDVVDHQPGIYNRLGEIGKMEARIHELRYEFEEAEAAYRTTHEAYSEAVRLLPRPRTPHLDQLFCDVLYFATRSEDYTTAAFMAREQDWLGHRWYMIEHEYTLDAALAFESLGLYPQALRELRYQLRRQPGNREVINDFARVATAGNLERVAIATLDDLDREGRLVPQAQEVRETLRERLIVIPEGGLDS